MVRTRHRPQIRSEPAMPSGWDGNYTNVTEDRDIYAMYRQLGDIQGDGKVNTGDATAILRYLVGTMHLMMRH